MTTGFLIGGHSLAPSGAFQINLSYDASTSGAPAGFKPAMDAAAAYLGSLIYLSTNITISVGWGEVNGGSPGSVAGSQYFVNNGSYSTTRNALISAAKSAQAISAIATWPASPPGGVTNSQVTYPWLVALGVASLSPPYAWIGFNSTAALWSFSGTPSAGQVDFREAALHELTECMGRNCNATGGNYTIPDMYCYSANATRNLTTTGTRYYSVDSGATNQRFMGNGDLGDWVANGGAGSLYNGTPSPFDGTDITGQLVPLLPCDTLMIDAMGYSSQ